MTRKAIAELFDVAPQTVGSWADSGCPRNEDKGRTFDLFLVIHWKIDQAQEAGIEEGIDSGAASEKDEGARRFHAAKADLEEIKVAERLKVFLRREDVEQQWALALTVYSQAWREVPGSLAGRLVGKSEAKIEKLLDRHLHRAFEQMKASYAAAETEDDD